MSTEAIGSLAACREGARVVAQAPARTKLLVALLFAFTLLMLPIGRGALHELRSGAQAGYARDADAGSLLAPLAFDSGFNFRLRPGADFFAIYEAGLRARSGDDPYSAGLEDPRRAPYATQFRYPVVTAYWLGAPLSVLPPLAAYAMWIAACVAMLLANFLLCVGRAREHVGVLALIWFAWFPVLPELHMGQFTLFLATLMLWGADALIARRRFAGAPWALAVLLKVYPLAWAPVVWREGRRRAVIATVLVLALSVIATLRYFPKGTEVGVVRVGVLGSVIAKLHQPYAGAQGLQSAINATCWKLSGRGFAEGTPDPPVPNLTDPTLILSLLMIAVYSAFALWAICGWWRDRDGIRLRALLGYLWLAWFIAYRDNWEHHYVLVQALTAFLVVQKLASIRQAAWVWALAGTPSLWYVWHKLWAGGGAVSEIAGLVYFIQRPCGLAVLLFCLSKSLHARTIRHKIESHNSSE